MKQILLLVMMLTTFLGLSSCNKTYTCNCVMQTVNISSGEVLQRIETSSPIEARNQSDAKTACESIGSNAENFGIRQTNSCQLKP